MSSDRVTERALEAIADRLEAWADSEELWARRMRNEQQAAKARCKATNYRALAQIAREALAA